MQEFWNNRYNEPELAYGKEPNQFLVEQLSKLKPGRILFPAEGEGRNAIYAAKQGWNVYAFDYSEAGRKKALQWAAAENLRINYQVSAAEDYKAPLHYFDAVALIYAHFPPSVRGIFHTNVITWLKPGGTVILEAFHPKQLEGYPSGGPKEASMLYDAAKLLSDFAEFDIKLLEEREVELNEGIYHQGKGYVTRMVAVKPL